MPKTVTFTDEEITLVTGVVREKGQEVDYTLRSHDYVQAEQPQECYFEGDIAIVRTCESILKKLETK